MSEIYPSGNSDNSADFLKKVGSMTPDELDQYMAARQEPRLDSREPARNDSMWDVTRRELDKPTDPDVERAIQNDLRSRRNDG